MSKLQAMRAILLTSATVTSLKGFFSLLGASPQRIFTLIKQRRKEINATRIAA